MRRQVTILAGALGLAAASFVGHVLAESSEPAVTFVSQQPVDEWLAKGFLGHAVHNATGETVGDVKDFVFDRRGRISTVVLGVGGFLGMGEKSVGVTYESLGYRTGAKGEHIIVVAVSKEALAKAADFKSTEKAAVDKSREKPTD
jgi:hypothetical protein